MLEKIVNDKIIRVNSSSDSSNDSTLSRSYEEVD